MAARSWIHRLFRGGHAVHPRAARRQRRNPPLAAERLEDRLAPATLSELDGGTTLLITLDNVDEAAGIISSGDSYKLSASSNRGNFNFVDGGVSSAGDFSGFGTPSLTIAASGLARYSAIRVEDTAANTAFAFLDSGSNAYSDPFTVALDNASSVVQFLGASRFGGNALDVKAGFVGIDRSATVSTIDGGITLWGNNQATPTVGPDIGVIVQGTVTSSGSGNLDIRGRGGNNPNETQPGVTVDSGGVVSSTGTGSITVVGTGGIGSYGNAGVLVNKADSLITSVRGAINITGTAVTNTALGSLGVVLVDGGKVTSTGTGAAAATITINGTGAAGTGANNGFRIEGAGAAVESVDGAVSVVATPGTGDRAIELRDSGQIKVTGSADVSLRATSGLIFIASSIVAPNSTLRLTAEAGDINGSNFLIDSSSGKITARNVSAYASGTIGLSLQNTVDGTFAARAGTGDVNFTSNVGFTVGTVGAAGGFPAATGVTAGGSVSVRSFSGTVTVNRPVSSGQDGSVEVYADQNLVVNANVTGGGGGVTVGVIGWRPSDTAGVVVQAGAVVTATGVGPVQVNGSGGNGPNGSHYGVVVTGGGTITSGGGDVTVAGTGGTGPNGSNHGVLVSGGTISAGGTGNVTVQGSGGSGGAPNYGVYVVGNNSAITSAGGMVLVQGFGGANSAAVRLDGGGAIASGNNATVGVSGDSLQFGGTTPGTISAGTGTVFLAAASPGTLIDLGGADVLSGPQLVLGVSAADLAQVTAGTLAVGGVGDVKVSAALDLSVRFGTLALISGGSIADANASGTDLKVAHLILSAGTGIGSGNPLETAVSKLTAVNTTSGTVEVSNTGPLTIDHAPPADAGGEADETGIKNTGGGVTVTTTGDLTVGASVSAGGDVALTSIGGGVQVGAPITADGFTVAVSAAGAITHAAGAGATVTAAGLVLQATSGIGLATAAGNLAAKNTTNNIQIINTGDLTVTTVGTVGGVTLSGVADPGGSVDINTTGDLTVDRPVTAGGVTQLTGGTGGGSAITLNATVGGTAVIVNGGPGADTFTLRSSPTVPLTVNGFEPAAPTTPGDALNFNANGLAVVYAASPLVAGTDKPVSVNGIETRTVYNFSTVIFTTDANAAVDIDLRRLIDPALLAANPTFTAGGAVNGTVTLLADGHTARFLPGPNSSAGGVGFTFTANGSGPFNVNVLVNHPPTVAAPAALTAYEDMDKAVTGITVGDPDSGRLTVTLKVGHGTLTLGTTAGLTVTGNGSASVTLSGDIAALNTALATLFYRGGLNYGGADTLSLTASDGSLGTAGSVAITVKSAAQQAADLQAQVTALQSRGVLTPGLANKLTSKLVLRGRAEDAGLVQEFLEKVQDFLRAGVLTQAQADALLGPGNILLLSVTRR